MQINRDIYGNQYQENYLGDILKGLQLSSLFKKKKDKFDFNDFILDSSNYYNQGMTPNNYMQGNTLGSLNFYGTKLS